LNEQLIEPAIVSCGLRGRRLWIRCR